MDGIQQVDYFFHWGRDNLNILRNGKPMDILAYKILSLFYDPPFPPKKPSFTKKDVTELIKPEQGVKVEKMVEQLEQDGFLIYNPESEYFQYNYNCPCFESQIRFEKAYMEEHLPKLPRCEVILNTNIRP